MTQKNNRAGVFVRRIFYTPERGAALVL